MRPLARRRRPGARRPAAPRRAARGPPGRSRSGRAAPSVSSVATAPLLWCSSTSAAQRLRRAAAGCRRAAPARCRPPRAPPPARPGPRARCRAARPARPGRAPGATSARWARHRLPAGADDDQRAVRPERGAGGQHVADQRAAADRVQHLGGRRPHPGALARGEHDDRGRAGVRHWRAPRCRRLAALVPSLGRGPTRAPAAPAGRVGQRTWLGDSDSNRDCTVQRPAGCRLPHPPPDQGVSPA